ncbi:MAG TPA: hypothetical protein VKA68_05320, partial [bacterium]|nr:hypothetical protein [bacterium]
MRAFFQRQSKGMLLVIIAVVALSTALFLGCENQSTVPTEPGLSTETMGSAKFQAQLQKVMAVQDRQTQRLIQIPGVVGTGTGLGPNGQPVVRVFVATPDVANIPAVVENIPVDVKVTGRFVARSDPTAWFDRPVPIGVSTGHPDITAGTIGARVQDESGNLFALSNNHVYADVNEANIGDDELQPGPYDGGSAPEDVIGQLTDYEPILFDGSNNTIDAAIASTTSNLVGTSTPADGYGTPSATTKSASVGMAVRTFARTTGLTSGEVSEVNVTVDVCYKTAGPFRCKKLARFMNQISITPGDFSDGGDSGSLIVDTNNNPVGLLFAGSSTRTLANPIDAVLTRFNVTIDAGQPVTDISVSGISAPASVVQGDAVSI